MTTVTLREHSRVPSELLELQPKDLDWIINENDEENQEANEEQEE